MTHERVDPMVGAAMPWPGVFAFAALVAVAVHLGFEGSVQALHEAGLFGPATLLACVAAAAFASAAVGVGMPRAVALGSALLPWVVAALGGLWSMSRVVEAIAHVNPADRAVMFSAGFAESLAARSFGAPVSAAIFAGIVVSGLVRARLRPAERAPSLALAALAFTGMGLAVASGLAALALHEDLGAFAGLSSVDRGVLAAAAEADANMGRAVGLALAALGAVAVLVVVALMTARDDGAPVGGAGLAVGVLLIVVGPALDIVFEGGALRDARASGGSKPWRAHAGFVPVAVEPRAIEGGLRGAVADSGEPVRVAVTKDSIWVDDRGFANVATAPTSSDVRAAISGLVSAAPARDGDAGPRRELRMMLDARAPAALVAAVVDGARRGNATHIVIVGAAPGGDAPGIAGIAAPVIELALALGCASVDPPEPAWCLPAATLSAAELAVRVADERRDRPVAIQ